VLHAPPPRARIRLRHNFAQCSKGVSPPNARVGGSKATCYRPLAKERPLPGLVPGNRMPSDAANSLLKNAFVAFFNLAKCRASSAQLAK
jgi:hypothetical protein